MKKPFNVMLFSLLPVALLAGCNQKKEVKIETLKEAQLREVQKELSPIGESEKFIFRNYDGKDIKVVDTSSSYSYVGEIPTRPDNEKYHYEFSNWNITYDINENATIANAEFKETLNEYEIRFMDGDALIDSQMVKYGELPVVPEGYIANETIKTVFGNKIYHAKTRGTGEVYTDGLVFELLDGKDEFGVINYYGTENDVVLPSYYRGVKVTTIFADAFINSPEVKTIFIPSTVNNIEPNAFRGIQSLNSLTLEEGNEKYALDGSGALYYTELYHEEEYKNLLYVPSGKVDLLEISSEYQTIEDGALNSTKATILKLSSRGFLKMIHIFGGDYKNNVKQIILTSGYLREGFCEDMQNLYSFKINEQPADSDVYYGETISERMFKNCSNLRGVSIPSQVTSIEEEAFMNCTSLEDVVLSFDDLAIENVASNAFENCPELKGYEKDGIVYLGNETYKYQIPVQVTKNIPEEWVIPDETLIIPNNFFEGNQVLRNVVFPENGRLSVIGDKAFYNCLNLDLYTEIHYAPLTLTNVGQRAFTGTKYNPDDTAKSAWIYAKVGGSDFDYKYILVNLLKNCSEFSLGAYFKFADYYGLRNGFASVVGNANNNNFEVHKNKILMESYKIVHGASGLTKITWQNFDNYGQLPYIAYICDYAFKAVELTAAEFFDKDKTSASNSISYIGKYAFNGAKFSNLYFGKYVSYVGERAFEYAISAKTTLNISKKLTYAGDSAFVSSYYGFALNFEGPSIPETWDPNFDGNNGANTANTYTFNVSF